MKTIIIGGSGQGKSTLAKSLANGRSIISAGEWVREKTQIFDHTPESAKLLAEKSQEFLDSDPFIAAKWIEGKCENQDVIIEGIRNPRDLLYLIRKGDHIIDIGGGEFESWEGVGLNAIRGMKSWLSSQGITWARIPRYLTDLIEPIKVQVLESWLHSQDETYTGLVSGKLISLECYQGREITGMFQGDNGGTFHDLPLEAFRMETVGHLKIDEPQCYGFADIGTPSVERGPLADKPCSVYNRTGNICGEGKAICCIHWPSGNTLLWLVHAGDKLLLWPPHKLLLGETRGGSLPTWKKLRYEHRRELDTQ